MYTINYPVTIDLNLLLKRSDTLRVDQNIDIFIKVQNFILKSKRFKTLIYIMCHFGINIFIHDKLV
jgi:hypothetical protein